MTKKVQIQRDGFLEALERLTLLMKEKSQADESVGRISFHGDRLYCKTEDTRASHEVPFLDGFDTFAIEGLDLYHYLQRLSDDTITVILEGDALVIQGKRAKAKFALFEPFHFPLPEKWKSIGKDFLPILLEAAKYVSKSYYRPVLTTVAVQEDFMKASDGLVFYEKKSEVGTFLRKEPTLIPGPSVPFIKSIIPDKFHVEDNILYFKQQPWLIGACSLLGGSYPPDTNIKNDFKKGVPVEFSKSTKEAVDRCSVFVETSRFEEDKKVFVELKNKEAILTVRSVTGRNREVVKVKYPDTLEGLVFCLRPDFFSEVLIRSNVFHLCEQSLQIKGDDFWFATALIDRK